MVLMSFTGEPLLSNPRFARPHATVKQMSAESTAGAAAGHRKLVSILSALAVVGLLIMCTFTGLLFGMLAAPAHERAVAAFIAAARESCLSKLRPQNLVDCVISTPPGTR